MDAGRLLSCKQAGSALALDKNPLPLPCHSLCLFPLPVPAPDPDPGPGSGPVFECKVVDNTPTAHGPKCSADIHQQWCADMQIIDANYFFTAAFTIEVVLQSIAKNFIIGPNGEP